jgi:hypothetical protein
MDNIMTKEDENLNMFNLNSILSSPEGEEIKV